MKRLVASVIVLTLVGVTAGMAEPKDGDGRGKDRSGRSDTDHNAARHERSAGVWQRMMDAFDKDSDGKLSQDEWKASERARYQRQSRDRERIMARFDKDGDGQLSEKERAAAREQFRKNNLDAMKRADKGGDGKLSEEKRAAKEQGKKRHQEMLKKFDKDGDGTLSEEERAEMKKARQARRQQHQRNGEGRKSRQD